MNQQINHFQPQGGSFQTARGTFRFNGNVTALQNGAPADRFNSWADFLLGYPSRAGKVEQLRNPNLLRIHIYSMYAQDQWQFTRKLNPQRGRPLGMVPVPDPSQFGIMNYTVGPNMASSNSGKGTGERQFPFWDANFLLTAPGTTRTETCPVPLIVVQTRRTEMIGYRLAMLAGLLAVNSVPLGCGRNTAAVDPQKLKAFAPLLPMAPASTGTHAERVQLGRMLYYDVRLSKSQTVSCNSCHPLSAYGADGQSTSEGYRKQHGARNAPSVYNAAMQFVQFWDGRAADVEAQAKGPLLNPVEMAMPSERAVLSVLNSMPEYVSAFRRAFPGEKNPVTLKHVSEAIGAFERGLITPSRWDEFLVGNQSVLTRDEKAGFNAFMAAGCAGCHSGSLLGGSTLQKLGVAQTYPDTSDPGRYKITGKETDRMSFKVPSLRNVAMTGPYFHNGKVSSLADAVQLMATYQTGKQLKPEQTRAIVTWLGSLTGNIPTDYIKQPSLPPATRRTPKPIA